MSYCRFGADWFQCDIYAYEHVGGYWIIEVANVKRIIPEEWARRIEYWKTLEVPKEGHQMGGFREAMKHFPIEPLAAPSAGKRFQEYTLQSFKERLLALRAEGCRFPDSVLARIDREADAAKTVQ